MSINCLFPQTNSIDISGVITDSSGEPLIGASIQVKGMQKATLSNLNGEFSLNVPANSVLVIRYMGFAAQEINVENQKRLMITLQEDENVLSEVTVTALGITREKKSLGYAVGEVKGEELQKAKEINVIQALAGKIPGLIINETAGGPSGSARVLIRGNTELSHSNEPLYVVDGVPLDNTNFGSADTYGGYDLGNGISNINPDDIENISVLKGPAASALYGSRASHGVILITTKKAGGKKKLGIEFNSTTTVDRQLTQYDIQTLYGQGGEGRIYGNDDIYTSSNNWGPKIDPGLWIIYFDGVQRPYKFIENNINGFFRTGITSTNTLVLNRVHNNSGVRLSYTNMFNQDIVPNTNMDRNTINLRATTQLLDKIEVDIKMNYVRENVQNRPALSGSGYSVGSNLMTLATTFDQAWLKNYENERGEYADWNGNNMYSLNPYWVVNAMKNNSVKDRFSGSGIVNYKINNKLNLRLTAGGEVNVFDFLLYVPPSTPGKPEGELQKRTHKNYTYNTEALLSYKDKFGSLDVGANIGANVFHVNNRTNQITGTEMTMRKSISLQSFLRKEIEESAYRKQINSVMGMVNVGYNNFLYIDATLRTDVSSTLPSHSRIYTYYSGSGAFVFSEILQSWKDILPYGKIRASYARVGSDTNPFQTGLTYNAPDKPYQNYPYATVDNRLYPTDDRARLPNKNLKPTLTNSVETGIDLKFLKNRIGFEFTYYQQNSKDQILFLPTAKSSAYDEKLLNAGNIENKGIEIALTTIPIQTKDFTWHLNFNAARNFNKIVALADGLDKFSLAKAEYLDVYIDAVTGENYGAITSPRGFQKTEDGQLIIDEKGLPKPLQGAEYKVLGNAMWDWTGGVSSSWSYKNITLSAIMDIKVGADLYSMTARSLYSTGKSKATLEGRDAWYRSEEERLEAGQTEVQWTPTGGLLVNGVVETILPDGSKTYTPNQRYVDPEDYWRLVGSNDPSAFIFDNSYVKIREITLSYRLPENLTGKWAEEMTVSFVSRNPFIVYKNIKDIDPDSNYNNGTGVGLEYGSLPSRRSYGVNINIKF
jgi:TonB-linked SusC/RagA family outer membrane protein